MAPKRKLSSKSSIGLKFRPSQSGTSNGGVQPVAGQESVFHILMLVVLHLCRKVLFLETEVKIGLYLFVLFVGSTIADFLPLPKTYFSNKHNVLNQYFVKLGWAWTLTLVGVFLVLSTNIYCCGQRPRLRRHVMRLVAATAVWYVVTGMFQYVERATGVCRTKTARFSTRASCVEAGHRWSGFDMSGHAFLLIFNNLLIVEEARAIDGWERIKDMIRNEDFARASDTNKDSIPDTPLQHICDAEYVRMTSAYRRHTPYIRLMFVLLTMLSILWDVMLVATVLYFHTMLQKMTGGMCAIVAWYGLYRWLYPAGLACLPGAGGAFKYQIEKKVYSQPSRSPASSFKRKQSANSPPGRDDMPRFMGMPLYALRNKGPQVGVEDAQASSSQ